MLRYRLLLAGTLVALMLAPVLARDEAAKASGHAGKKGSGGAFDPNAARQPSPQTAAAINLQTAEVGFGPIEETIRLSGTVRARPDKRVVIAPPVEGTLASLMVQPGDRVRRGDVIAVVNSPQLARMVHEQLQTEVEYEHARSEVVSTRASLDTLRRQITAAEEQARLAEGEVNRLRAGAEAVSANILAQRESVAIQARSQAEGLKLTLTQQSRELESLERRAEASGRAAAALGNVIGIVEAGVFADRGAPPPLPAADSAGVGGGPDVPVGVLRLRSPLDGVVLLRSGTLGQGVQAGQTLVEIGDYSSVQIEGELPESLTDRIVAGTGGGGKPAAHPAVRIRRVSDGPVLANGTVRSTAPLVDPVKRTSHLLIDADNADGALREGLYVDLAIVLRSEKTAVIVPRSAVVSDGPLQFVFVKEHDEFVKRDIQPGARDDRSIEILSGLIPGDVIAVSGAYSLSQLRPVGAEAAAEDPHAGHNH